MLIALAFAAAVPLVLTIATSTAPDNYTDALPALPTTPDDQAPPVTPNPSTAGTVGSEAPEEQDVPEERDTELSVPTPAESGPAAAAPWSAPAVAPTSPDGSGEPTDPSPTTSDSEKILVSLEAEGADWRGPARQCELPEASGGIVVSGGEEVRLLNLLVLRNGVSARFSDVTVPESGEYTLTFYYAARETRRTQVVVTTGGGPHCISTPRTTAEGRSVPCRSPRRWPPAPMSSISTTAWLRCPISAESSSVPSRCPIPTPGFSSHWPAPPPAVATLTRARARQTHAACWEEYGENIEKIGVWYDNVSLSIAVPAYVNEVNSLADLAANADLLNGETISIEPGAGLTATAQDKVIPRYGLEGVMEPKTSSVRV